MVSILKLSDGNGSLTHIHLLCKRTLKILVFYESVWKSPSSPQLVYFSSSKIFLTLYPINWAFPVRKVWNQS